MNIRIFGFEWELGEGISYEDLCSYLASLSGRQFEDRIIALSKKDRFWAGVFLTIKNDKAYCKMKRVGGGSFKITPQQLEEGTNMVAFNFFIVDPETGRGLYQHYNHSASTNTFCAFCSDRYKELKQSRIDTEAKELGLAANSQSIRMKKVREQFKGGLTYSVLVRKEAFDQLVRDLALVKVFECELETITEEESTFTPLAKYAKRVSHRFIFPATTMMGNIKSSIIRLSKDGLKRGRVVGVDPHGREEAYKILQNKQSFAEYDYDDVIKTVEIDSDNLVDSIQKSYIVQEILGLAKQPKVKALITTPAR